MSTSTSILIAIITVVSPLFYQYAKEKLSAVERDKTEKQLQEIYTELELFDKANKVKERRRERFENYGKPVNLYRWFTIFSAVLAGGLFIYQLFEPYWLGNFGFVMFFIAACGLWSMVIPGLWKKR